MKKSAFIPSIRGSTLCVPWENSRKFVEFVSQVFLELSSKNPHEMPVISLCFRLSPFQFIFPRTALPEFPEVLRTHAFACLLRPDGYDHNNFNKPRSTTALSAT